MFGRAIFVSRKMTVTKEKPMGWPETITLLALHC